MDDWRQRRPPWFLVCTIVVNLTIFYLFVAFWNPSLVTPLRSIAPFAFVAAVFWELFQIFEDNKAIRTETESREGGEGVGSRVIALVFVLLSCSPAFIVAGIAAVRA
jgi:hypothetical protein